MSVQELSDMSLGELYAARERAVQAVQAAEYQDGLRAYQEAKGAATWWVQQIDAEIGRRLDATKITAWHEQGNNTDA